MVVVMERVYANWHRQEKKPEAKNDVALCQRVTEGNVRFIRFTLVVLQEVMRTNSGGGSRQNWMPLGKVRATA